MTYVHILTRIFAKDKKRYTVKKTPMQFLVSNVSLTFLVRFFPFSSRIRASLLSVNNWNVCSELFRSVATSRGQITRHSLYPSRFFLSAISRASPVHLLNDPLYEFAARITVSESFDRYRFFLHYRCRNDNNYNFVIIRNAIFCNFIVTINLIEDFFRTFRKLLFDR